MWLRELLSARGGTGTFESLVRTPLPDDKLQYCWRYTRFAAYKKDNAELAIGYMVLNKTGQSLTGKPKFVLLAEIEADIGNNATVYGHAITRGGTKVTTRSLLIFAAAYTARLAARARIHDAGRRARLT